MLSQKKLSIDSNIKIEKWKILIETHLIFQWKIYKCLNIQINKLINELQ